MIIWDLLTLFWTFFKIGACTFGGGLAMLKLAQEQVTKLNWLEPTEVTNFVAISESTPGPFAINMATYVGAGQEDILGAIAATLGVVLPSFVIILLLRFASSPTQHTLIWHLEIKGLRGVMLINSTGVFNLILVCIFSSLTHRLFILDSFLRLFSIWFFRTASSTRILSSCILLSFYCLSFIIFAL